MIWLKLASFAGILTVVLIVWITSRNRRKFPWRVVLWGMGLQWALAIFVLSAPWGVQLFQWIGEVVKTILSFSDDGVEFMFGNLSKAEKQNVFGYQFALVISGTVIFFSAIVSTLYHFGIMQKLVFGMAWVMERTMGASGIESLSAASNIFVGQTEAPIMVKNYLATATRSEIFSIMVGGFATIAGGVFAAYVQMGVSPSALMAASLISAPGGLLLSKISMPQTEETLSLSELKTISKPQTKNMMDAITVGAGQGMKLALNIVAMMVAFIALIALVDWLLGLVDGGLESIGVGFFPASLKELFGFIFQPFAYIVGIPPEEARTFGSLLGTKISVNEFVAYADLTRMTAEGTLSPRTITISSFALCGFANIGSIAIQIGGLSALEPSRRSEFASLGVRAMAIGALANLATASIASVLL